MTLPPPQQEYSLSLHGTAPPPPLPWGHVCVKVRPLTGVLPRDCPGGWCTAAPATSLLDVRAVSVVTVAARPELGRRPEC